MNLNKIPAIFLMFSVILIIVLSTTGCDGQTFVLGEVSNRSFSMGEVCYVILDDDNDPSNGNVAYVTVNTTESNSIAYLLETTDVPEGSYFLLAGYDESGVGVRGISGWTSCGYYETDSYSAPEIANVSDLNKRYDFGMTDGGPR